MERIAVEEAICFKFLEIIDFLLLNLTQTFNFLYTTLKRTLIQTFFIVNRVSKLMILQTFHLQDIKSFNEYPQKGSNEINYRSVEN